MRSFSYLVVIVPKKLRVPAAFRESCGRRLGAVTAIRDGV